MKGNMLLGKARGAIGDVVFTHYKGQQTAHSRNRNPHNPKSEPQMLQRSQFINAVKFFTRGTQNLFKFAFENKDEKESDFNAFMRANRNVKVNISRNAFNLDSYPALGRWQLTQGSLPPAQLAYAEFNTGTEMSFEIGIPEEGEIQTIGQLSKAILMKYDLQEGDYVTFVQITCPKSTMLNTPSINPEERDPIKWGIGQFRLDVNSNIFTEDMLPEISADIFPGEVLFNTFDSMCISACSVIFSRKTRRKLLTSTAFLEGNGQFKTALELTQQQGYIEEVLESWGTNYPNILEGSLSEEPDARTVGGVNKIFGLTLNPVALANSPSTDIGDYTPQGYVKGVPNYFSFMVANADLCTKNMISVVNAGNDWEIFAKTPLFVILKINVPSTQSVDFDIRLFSKIIAKCKERDSQSISQSGSLPEVERPLEQA